MRIGKQNRMLERLTDRFDTKIYGGKGRWERGLNQVIQ